MKKIESVSKIVEMIVLGQVGPDRIHNKLIDRISKYDKLINSYTTLDQNSHEIAKELSTEISKGKIRGPLHGIPASIKDIINTEGIKTSYGSLIYGDNVPTKDATVVKKLKENGSYVIGKNTTHEFALGIVSLPARNPWNQDRVTGGSSGGSAAAVSAGLSLFSIGTDTGGSIRIPAAMCGVTGLKPTFGKVSVSGVFPESWSLDHVGPIARYASDLPLILGSTGYRLPASEKKEKYNVAILWNFFDASKKGVKKQVESELDRMSSENTVEIVDYTPEDFNRIFHFAEIIDAVESTVIHERSYKERGELYLDTSKHQFEFGSEIKAVDYLKAKRYKDRATRAFIRSMKGIDALISPTIPDIAPTINEAEKLSLDELSYYMKFVQPFDYLGTPAVSIPAGFHDGLPVGLQIISKPNEDYLAIAIAERFQETTNYHKLIPDRFGPFEI